MSGSFGAWCSVFVFHKWLQAGQKCHEGTLLNSIRLCVGRGGGNLECIVDMHIKGVVA